MLILLNLASDPTMSNMVQKRRREFYEKTKINVIYDFFIILIIGANCSLNLVEHTNFDLMPVVYTILLMFEKKQNKTWTSIRKNIKTLVFSTETIP